MATLRCVAAPTAVAPAGVDLSGYWKLNPALSEDPEKLLQQRLEDERKERDRWLRRQRMGDPLGIPPIGEAPPGDPAAAPDPNAPAPAAPRKRPRNRQLEELRRMLDVSDTLTIRQSGTRISVESQLNSNSFDAGTKSQISMPQGELADQRVGWEGPSFVIERRSRGPRMTQRYRLLKKTDQLESVLSWSGDSPLAGIKVRRVFDRMAAAPPPPDPDSGPVK